MKQANISFYLHVLRQKYARSTKKEKSIIINELCESCGYHRKAAIRILNNRPRPAKQRPGPAPTYDANTLLPILKTFWMMADWPCSKRLKALLPKWLPSYEQEYGPLADDTKSKLISLSASTIDRMLKPVRTQMGHKGRSGTKPGTLLKQQIPIRVDHWNEKTPGFIEADTVALCGNSLKGNFVWCLTMTDIYTTWTEGRATWNKGSAGVIEQIQDIENKLPFDIKGFDCDNGTEFLNRNLVAYFLERENPVEFTRSRPYRKNDNAHVEQKNWTFIRQLFGYDRFEQLVLVELMNDLMANEWSLYQNHFMPSSKLTSKHRENSKYVRKYDEYQTAYERIMKNVDISKETKVKLANQHRGLNPFHLKREIERKLKVIFKYVTVTSNVRQRL